MEGHFIGRNVNLEELADALAKYLEGEGFSVTVNKGDEVVSLIVRGKNEGKVRQIAIKLIGKPENFIVRFICPKKLYPIFYSSTFWQFFGAGFILREIYREIDFYHSVENKFWRKIEEMINNFPTCNQLSPHS